MTTTTNSHNVPIIHHININIPIIIIIIVPRCNDSHTRSDMCIILWVTIVFIEIVAVIVVKSGLIQVICVVLVLCYAPVHALLLIMLVSNIEIILWIGWAFRTIIYMIVLVVVSECSILRFKVIIRSGYRFLKVLTKLLKSAVMSLMISWGWPHQKLLYISQIFIQLMLLNSWGITCSINTSRPRIASTHHRHWALKIHRLIEGTAVPCRSLNMYFSGGFTRQVFQFLSFRFNATVFILYQTREILIKLLFLLANNLHNTLIIVSDLSCRIFIPKILLLLLLTDLYLFEILQVISYGYCTGWVYIILNEWEF